MNKLNKKQRKAKAERVAELGEARSDLEDALDIYNAALVQAESEVDEAIAEYNRVREEVANYVQEVANDAELYYDEKSDRWQEGERGGEHKDWQESWATLADQLGELFDYTPAEPVEAHTIEYCSDDLNDIADEPGLL